LGKTNAPKLARAAVLIKFLREVLLSINFFPKYIKTFVNSDGVGVVELLDGS
jgi:hypothetical protein